MNARRWIPILTAVGLITAAGLTHPGVTARLGLIGVKLAGDTRMPWREVGIRLAPWSLQPGVRRWLGTRAEPWMGSLAEVRSAAAAAGGRSLIFEGPTPNLLKLNCHLSTLEAGETPHPPHSHVDEELILPLEGEVEILSGESSDSPDLRVESTGPGGMVFHDSGKSHTIRASGPGPSTYLVLRWRGEAREAVESMASRTLDLDAEWQSMAADSSPNAKRVVVDEPTAFLGKLHIHLTRLAEGAESPEHSDLHDVVMVTLEGVIETLGKRVEPSSVIFHPAHIPHSIRNIGGGPARYLVIEFHSSERD